MRVQLAVPVAAFAVAGLLPAGAPRQGDLYTFQARGMLDAQMEQAPSHGRKGRMLLSYTYDDHGMDLVAFDPESGKTTVLGEPGTGEFGGKSLAELSDGSVLIGTYPKGHLLKLDASTDRLTDLGRPCPQDGECWIWDLVKGADGKIYGATSPQAKLIRFDPATGRIEDLGRMDPVNTHARFVAATPDGFIYVATGYLKPQVVAYKIATGEHRLLLPDLPSTSSTPSLFRDASGDLFLRTSKIYRLSGFSAVEQPAAPMAAPLAGRRVDLFGRLHAAPAPAAVAGDGGGRRLLAAEARPSAPIAYNGKPRPIFRLTAGANWKLYCSSVLPDYFFSVDLRNGQAEQLGVLGPGEIYQMIPVGDQVLMAAYSAFGGYQLLNFSTRQPFAFDYDVSASAWVTPKAQQNPSGFAIPPTAQNWRPEAMVKGPDGMVYVSGVPGYGQTGAVLQQWNPSTQSVKRFQLDPDLSVISLCPVGDLLAVGLSTEAGTGAKSSATEARLLLWRPSDGQVVFSGAVAPGATRINNLVAAPDGRLFGMAGTSQPFVMDVASRRVRLLNKLPLTCNIYSSAGLGPDGRIYGLAKEGVYVMDPASGQCGVYASATAPITAGFAIMGNRIYYASGPTVSWTELGAH